jgi:hypothetical protein
MNIENAYQNVGCYFTVMNRRCKVTGVKTIGGINHYGFESINSSIIGWIPCDLIGGCEYTA